MGPGLAPAPVVSVWEPAILQADLPSRVNRSCITSGTIRSRVTFHHGYRHGRIL
jgi:hypothetical protein